MLAQHELTLVGNAAGGIVLFVGEAGDVADPTIGGGGGKVGAAGFPVASPAAADCDGGGSCVVVVWAMADDVSDRQPVKVERSGIA